MPKTKDQKAAPEIPQSDHVQIVKVVERRTEIADKSKGAKPGDKKEHISRTDEPFNPAIVVPRDNAVNVLKAVDEQLQASNDPDSKTKRTAAARPVNMVSDFDAWRTTQQRNTKRELIRKTPGQVRNLLGMPAPDADDETIDAWDPNSKK